MADIKESRFDKIMRQIESLESLRNEGIQELLTERKGIDEKLAQLGYTENSGRGATSKRRGGTRTPNPDKICPLCDFITDPPHDARMHRSQQKKQAFSAAELTEKGLKKRT